MPYAVYILECSDCTYYTGLTKDLEGRVYEHQMGAHPDAYTFSRRPVKLVWSVVSESYQEAFQWGHQIKGWSRAKKQALIRGDIDGVHETVKSERRRREQNKSPRADRRGRTLPCGTKWRRSACQHPAQACLRTALRLRSRWSLRSAR